MDFWLGIDCGGTFIKAAIYDSKGKEYGNFRQNLTIINAKPGWAERNLTALWAACAEVIAGAIQSAKIAAEAIKGVGISAQGKGLYLLDKQKQPLGYGIISADQRALDIVKQWQADGIPQTLYPLTRQTLWTGHPVSILRWLKEHEPERYAQIGSVLMTHDYLRFCLTGEIACEETNISESNLYNMQTGQYDPKLAQLLGIDDIMPALPPIVGSSQIAGYITEQAAKQTGLKAGTAVVGGLFDVVSTALCAGLDDESKLNAVLGTWSVVSGITNHIDDSQALPFVYGRHAQQGEFIVHEASPTSAANLEWFTKQWNVNDYNAINQAVAALPKAESSVLFVPFLYGSNAGLGMQAGFYGLQSLHTQDHLWQAIYEGVIFSLAYHLERMLQRFPKTSVIRVTGGPARSPVWMQILADLTGLPIEIPQIEETGCLGAALMAMVGNQVFSDSKQAQHVVSAQMKRIEPDSTVYDKYQNKYKKYKLLLESLKHFNNHCND
ncbi:3-keto-L-gulonate kinase /L-xylulose kinase [Pasteurella testudinis DSM 23072]|uniref:3-keto-L-gulonate kinase /L-xylulose kinase n=1 Tax=Pasteurella testudinis DSM 23072 TaxID=1122938 RepID=A0A1W1V0S4_9PAST|nr:FGGY-family carbohydrate kinase [Pasteurella testudinis]SMB86939.1 3-keto-L-gulonate kinase /L-xylulose kinase [Pasteurella testudinis DSM 23072]SUB51733.1 L-xylulose kinase [Pasteurella testudinis]SUB98514.1 L-xylulose kinase [Pasteurella testudinis]